MSQYERVVDANGVVRYKLEGKFVKAAEVPEDVKASLSDVVPAEPVEEPVVDESEVETPEEESTEAVEEVPAPVVGDEVAEESVVEEETPRDPAAPEVDPAADADDIDDESGIDEEVTPTEVNHADEVGMGFPMKNGHTVDIFDGKTPHETVRFVEGLMVPLTMKNYNEKSVPEIIARLKKMKKL